MCFLISDIPVLIESRSANRVWCCSTQLRKRSCLSVFWSGVRLAGEKMITSRALKSVSVSDHRCYNFRSPIPQGTYQQTTMPVIHHYQSLGRVAEVQPSSTTSFTRLCTPDQCLPIRRRSLRRNPQSRRQSAQPLDLTVYTPEYNPTHLDFLPAFQLDPNAEFYPVLLPCE